MKKQTIIIVGAGIAGLTAAQILGNFFNVILLEGNNRLGGRIHSIDDKAFGGVIETGPEFIHGDAEHTLALLKQAGIDYVEGEGKMYRKVGDVLTTEHEMVDHWGKLLKAMRDAPDEATLIDFLQQHFSDDVYAGLRKQAIAYAEGFDLADASLVTVGALYTEWANEGNELHRIPAGYSALVHALEKECRKLGCTIITNAAVSQIDWQKGSVSVTCSNGNNYNAEKILITSAIGLLQNPQTKNAIRFTPAINDYIHATQQIGWGQVIKVLLAFDKSFWKEDMSFVVSAEAIPTWWTLLPDRRPILTGWAGSHKAKALQGKSDDEIIETALNSLAAIFSSSPTQLRNKLTASKILNWQRDEWSHGAYTYAIRGTKESRQLLNTPISDTIYFAGEGLYDGTHPGTVEAAIANAKEVAGRIVSK